MPSAWCRSPATQSYWSVHTFRRRAAWGNRHPRLHKRSFHGPPTALAKAFAGCAQYEPGHFTAYARLAQDHPDIVLHLGDCLDE
ncbi:hypothetical protein C9424_17350 [Arthrobacter sp. H-02-3]|nr:hypothetical protein C9424_17350 [Arthrobacter sp. H-02-3]